MRLGAVLALALASQALANDPPDPRRILHLLSYVSKDYAEAAEEKDAGELAEQRGFLKEATRQLAMLPDKPERAAIAADLSAALDLVTKVAPKEQVAGKLERVAAALTRAYPAPLEPPATASLASGKSLYAKACATCHGVDGRANGPAVHEMKPKPIKFTDANEMTNLSPAAVHDTICYGVTGTPMPSFEGLLAPQERWDIAYYVFTLRPGEADPKALPANTLPHRELAFLTDGQLEESLRSQGVPKRKVAAARKALRSR